MMETKLWAALCALLLVNSGSADYSEAHTAAAPTSRIAPGTEAGPVTKAAYSEAVPTEHPTTHGLSSDSNPSLHDNSSLSNSTTASQEVTVETLTSEKNENSATQLPSQSAVSHPPRPTSVDLPSTSHTTDSITVISPTHVAHTFSVDVTATQLPDHNASHSPTPALPDSSSDQLSQPKTTSSTLASTSKSPKLEHTSAAFSTLSTSTPSTASSHQPPNSLSSTHTSSSESHHETTTKAQLKSSTITKLPSGPSAQAKTHTDNLSQLNGNDPTMVHDSPTLDPLLAGLVSAFIITAVIITLLLFLKLRRRDNRPEFRRLQDLPMDDMMEDTPLSMYSY